MHATTPNESRDCDTDPEREVRAGQGTIRKLIGSEHERFRDHLLRLDKESRRLRFAHGVSDSFIEDYALRMSDMGGIVFAYIVAGEVRAVAELRKLGDTWGHEAEAAFSVERAYQNLGIGNELMGRVIRAARNRGVRLLYMSCLAENAKMQAIARRHEADLKFEYGEVIGEIIPETPSYFSLLAEAIDDRAGYLMAVLDLQARRANAA
ncbi:MAG: GNAT family N-acetyltransferase [Hyphomicrobiaceae bacterium]